MKKILALILTALMTLGLFASCDAETPKDGNNADSSVILPFDKGEQGAQGIQGPQGIQGEKGDKGDSGRGIVKSDIINGELWVTYSDDPENPVCLGVVASGVVDVYGLDFYPLPDGTYGVKAGNSHYLSEVVVPATYNGKAVTQILDSGFSNAPNLEKITLPDSIKSIGESAFSSCTGLTSVTIPNSVTSIGDSAFSGTKLTSVTIPNSVTSIGDYAFRGCDELTSITIGSGVMSIGYGTLGYRKLVNITVDANNNVYKSIDGNLYTKDGKTILKYAIGKSDTSFVIPEGVTTIGGGAFNEATLTSVTIPNSVTSIGGAAFYGCTGLTSVTIPNSVTSIGDYAFYYCTGLTSVSIGSGVTSISPCAFEYCTGLTSAIFENTNGWKNQNGVSISESMLSDAAKAATYLTDTYCNATWTRSDSN